MINIIPIPYTGIEEILNNIDFYKKKFVSENVIVFRDANLSLSDQKNFNKKVGEKFGWKPYNLKDSHYQENHSHNKLLGKAGADDLMLWWHIEHAYYSNPIVVGMWNMFKLKAPVGAGKTYFIDTSIIYNRLTSEDKDFLNSCTLKGPESQRLNTFYQNTEYSAVSKHWITGIPILRTPLNYNCENLLAYVNSNSPTENEETRFQNILHGMIDTIKSDESIRMVHTWKQGDLVIMDGSLAHAVTGGFSPEDREFYGMWGHRDHIEYEK